MSSYLAAVEELCCERPDLAIGKTSCAICGIVVLTDPRNSGRLDIRCYFGCREIDRRRRSSERSSSYYRTPEGRDKRAALNAARPRAPPPAKLPRTPPIIRHLCSLLSLVEKRKVAPVEVIQLLKQHSMESTCPTRQTPAQPAEKQAKRADHGV